ncbi:hypothetical protein CVS48_13245 [Achromobacter spanius]|nr:hypothetical protein CVS48_13245 [Achromobacter spanius]
MSARHWDNTSNIPAPPAARRRKPSAWTFMTVIFQLVAGPDFYPWRLGLRVIALSCRENRMPQ